MRSIAYQTRFSAMMYGFYRLLWFSSWVSADFGRRVAEKDLSFLMTSKERRCARHFRFRGGKVSSGIAPCPPEFTLCWKDEATGGRIMTDMLRGKRKALANAVIRGDLLLEGDAALVFRFLETMNRMDGIYRKKKRK